MGWRGVPRRRASVCRLLATGLVMACASVHGETPHGTLIALDTVEPGLKADDLARLRPLIERAQVIGLAEAAHGVHEFLALRNRLFRYLVENFGFTAIAVETGFTESTAIDDYVLGHRALTSEIVRSVFSWSDESYLENRELLEWMRAYNARPLVRRPLRFYGIDLSGPGPGGLYEHARIAVDAALTYIGELDPAAAEQLRRRITPQLQYFNVTAYGSLNASSRDALTAALADMEMLFERRRVIWLESSTPRLFHRAARNAAVARHLDANFRASGWGFSPRGKGDLNQRDAAMADTVSWILDQERPEGKVLLFAATSHLNQLHGINTRLNDRPWTPLGAHLRHMLAASFVSIGAFSGDNTEGFPYGSLRPAQLEDHLKALATGGSHSLLAVDFSGEGPSEPRSFDAAVYIAKTRPAQVILDSNRNAIGLERLTRGRPMQ